MAFRDELRKAAALRGVSRRECRHRGPEIDHIERSCCGRVARFRCAARDLVIEETRCRSCYDFFAPQDPAPAERPFVTVGINTHNEGPRVRSTVQAFRDHLGDWPHEFIVVADEVTDHCCDDLGPGVQVIRNDPRVGCGRAKLQIIAAGVGEVFLFLDAHQSVVAGSVGDMARRAAAEAAIWTPVIHDIEYDREWRWRSRKTGNQIPCDRGMRMRKGQYTVKNGAWAREHQGADIRMVGVGFAISRQTLQRIGGLNGYLGLHGSQERGIALRAFMAGVPIRLDGTVVLGHEYRAGRPLPRNYRKWGVKDQARNFWHAYFVVVKADTFELLRPLLQMRARRGDGVTTHPDVLAERRHFLDHCKRRDDAELLEFLGVKRPHQATVEVAAPRPAPGLLAAVKAEDLPPAFVERWTRCASWGAGVVQHPGEMAEVFRRLQQDPPRRVLEIGAEGGGSLYVYAGACAPGATLVAVDDGRHAGRAATLAKTIARLEAEGFAVAWIQGDSHDAKTRAQVAASLGGAPDFVHIDGDHTTAGALQDWRDYGALARPGGLVAMHDIAYPLAGVRAAWRQIAGSGVAAEAICLGEVGGHQPMGVGLIRQPEESGHERSEDRGDLVRAEAVRAAGRADGRGVAAQSSARPDGGGSDTDTGLDRRAGGPLHLRGLGGVGPKIDVRIAYEPGARIGADYNRIMRESAQEWVLFLDHDVLLLHPSWYEVCQRAILDHPGAGLLTCWTNNIACKHQKDLGAPAGHDLAAPRARARALWQQHGYGCTINRKWLIAGFFMLTSKTAWTQAGGFPEDGFFGVDNEYDRRVRRAGFKTYRMDGLYCYHIRERQDRDWIEGVPTSATLARTRTPVEIKRSSDPIGASA